MANEIKLMPKASLRENYSATADESGFFQVDSVRSEIRIAITSPIIAPTAVCPNKFNISDIDIK